MKYKVFIVAIKEVRHSTTDLAAHEKELGRKLKIDREREGRESKIKKGKIAVIVR